MALAIIDYGSGNLHSVQKACERVADGMDVVVTSDPAVVRAASHVLLPGVGAYGDCVRGLKALDGMVDALSEHALEKKKPFLGICVGMQMLFERGHEHGAHEGLGWLKGEVRPLKTLLPKPECDELNIPHMGWNSLVLPTEPHPLFDEVEQGADVYFVHSYAAAQAGEAGAALPVDTIAAAHYGAELCAAVAQDNIMGTQFHPEKSQSVGLKLLANFIRLG